MFAKVILVLSFSGCLAWMRPKRCLLDDGRMAEQNISGDFVKTDINQDVEHITNGEIAQLYEEHKYPIRNETKMVNASIFSTPVKPNITEEVERIKKELAEEYKDHKYSKNPVKARKVGFRQINLYAPIKCSFSTAAEKLTSIVCQSNVSCTISQAVTTVDTYTAMEGYNWGVKASAKWTLIDKIFDVGGEVSTGGSYSCSFTKGKTTTKTVQCVKPISEHGILDLYNIKTQMYCSFGTSLIKDEVREGQEWHIFKHLTENEYYTILNNVIRVNGRAFTYMLDTDGMPELLLKKMKEEAPLFNPNTDIVATDGLPRPQIAIEYYKIIATTEEEIANVPFTNSDGDMPHTFVCTFTPR